MPEPRTAQQHIVVTNWRDLKHPQAGGAELVCQEFAALTAAAGHRVTLLTAKVKGRPRCESTDGYTIRRAGGRFTVYLHALLWLLLHRRSVHAVLDSQNGIPFFTPLAVRRRTPVILLLHHIHQQQFGQYFPAPVAAVGRFLESTGCRHVYGRRSIVAVSPSTRQGARRELRLRGEIRITPPGWRITTETAAGLEKTLAPSIVCVGRLVPHKRTRIVIEAMPDVLAEHPEAELHIVGVGPERERLAQIAVAKQVSHAVTFHDQATDAQRDALVAQAWIAVSCSSGEGWGISVIEANALGTPVLAFDRPGLRDSIKDGETGWLIPEGDAIGLALADRLKLLGDGSGTMREVTRRWAGNFTWERMTAKLLAVIHLERQRLQLIHPERRHLSDVATVVRIPVDDLPEGWTPDRLRQGDAVTWLDGQLTLLLIGVDIPGSRPVLRRIGLPDLATGDLHSIRVARGSDHLLPFER
ncbi:glycosyltransferase family 4 protein [Kineosporia babensis]|uniref:Glycosyltransferase family 4 protein n=1 Tax=Kineosporia babensis TaxID=499548 RepID=A0A9X1SYB9_9ACTN|nr:glycosyltransferase family 4 protein [Kineosporia babensis]MCD5316734.1 glycosyltransferase family 4 protein [Kineosporia babensis]